MLAPGGETFVAEPGERLLDAALRHGITLPHDCRQGTCGTCRARCKMGSLTQVMPSDPQNVLTVGAGQDVLTCLAVTHENTVLECAPVEPRYLPRKLPARVRKIAFPIDDVAILSLQLGTGQMLQYRAGQYLRVDLPGGVRRNYSIASFESESGGGAVELHIRKVPGGIFSTYVFERLKPRDVVRLEGPWGQFFLRSHHTGPVIFLATGTGFAPVKAMLEQMQKDDVERDVYLYWGGRRLKDLYLRQWVRDQQAQMPRLNFVPVVSQEPCWAGRSGHVQERALEDHADLSKAHVYACGSPAMVNDARQKFVAAGLPENMFFSDTFLPAI